MLVNIYIYIYKHYFQKEAYTYTIIDEMVKPKNECKKKATLLDNFVI